MSDIYFNGKVLLLLFSIKWIVSKDQNVKYSSIHITCTMFGRYRPRPTFEIASRSVFAAWLFCKKQYKVKKSFRDRKLDLEIKLI